MEVEDAKRRHIQHGLLYELAEIHHADNVRAKALQFSHDLGGVDVGAFIDIATKEPGGFGDGRWARVPASPRRTGRLGVVPATRVSAPGLIAGEAHLLEFDALDRFQLIRKVC